MSPLPLYKSLVTNRFILSRLGTPSLIMNLYYSSNMKLIFLHFVLVYTIESVLQRLYRGVSVFDPMVRPPRNAFSIERHHLLCPIGELIQLEGVFKRIKQTRVKQNSQKISLTPNVTRPFAIPYRTIEHAVRYRTARHDRFVVVIAIGLTAVNGVLQEKHKTAFALLESKPLRFR